jgi:hypothetical protein
MVGTGADDAHADAVALVPAGVPINDVDAIPGVEVVDSTLTVDAPDLAEVSMMSLHEMRSSRGKRKEIKEIIGEVGRPIIERKGKESEK